jgi:hypothetical protein
MSAWSDHSQSPATVTIPTERVLEAVAYLFATSAIWTSFAGGGDSEIDARYLVAGTELFEAAFGDDSSREYASPMLVEAEARSHEVAADLLELLASDVSAHRATAKRMREAGTIDVPFRDDVAPM